MKQKVGDMNAREKVQCSTGVSLRLSSVVLDC